MHRNRDVGFGNRCVSCMLRHNSHTCRHCGGPRPMLTISDVEAAASTVYTHMPPTPQYQWPLLSRRAGCEVWVKHENHSPIGCFKLRGGLTYLEYLSSANAAPHGVIAPTRGNHGQSIAL